MIGETGERKSAVATHDGKSRKKKKKKMLVSGYNNIIVLPNCAMLYYVFSGPLSLRAYMPEIKFNNK